MTRNTPKNPAQGRAPQAKRAPHAGRSRIDLREGDRAEGGPGWACEAKTGRTQPFAANPPLEADLARLGISVPVHRSLTGGHPFRTVWQSGGGDQPGEPGHRAAEQLRQQYGPYAQPRGQRRKPGHDGQCQRREGLSRQCPLRLAHEFQRPARLDLARSLPAILRGPAGAQRRSFRLHAVLFADGDRIDDSAGLQRRVCSRQPQDCRHGVARPLRPAVGRDARVGHAAVSDCYGPQG